MQIFENWFRFTKAVCMTAVRGTLLPTLLFFIFFYCNCCSVDKIDAAYITEEVFQNYSFEKPLLITNWVDQFCQSCKLYWNKSHLIEKYGNFSVKLGKSAEITNNHGDGVNTLTLSEFLLNYESSGLALDQIDSLEKENFYTFDKNQFLANSELLSSLELPQFYNTRKYSQLKSNKMENYLLVGGQYSGVTLHRHGDGWNILFQGEKHWIFYPPQIRPLGQYPCYKGHFHWMKENIHGADERREYYEIVQKAGDFIYIPEGWYHGTFNKQLTVGIASQYSTAFSQKDLKYYYKGKSLIRQYLAMKSEPDSHLVNDAISLFKQAIPLNDQAAFDYYNEIGMGYEIINSYELALSYFKQSLQSNEFFADGFYNAARMYNRFKNYTAAISCSTRAIELNPSDPSYYHNLGNSFNKLKQFDKAIVCYEKSLLLSNNKSLESFRSLGNIYKLQKQFLPAKNIFEMLINEKRYVSATVLNDYGCILAEMGKLEEAKKIFVTALNKFPHSVELTYQNLANVYEIQKKFQEAIKIYEKLYKPEYHQKLKKLYNKIAK